MAQSGSAVAKTDWIAPDLERQIKDNDVTSCIEGKLRSKKEREKLKKIEENMDKITKSLIYDKSAWSKLHENKKLPHSNDWLYNNENDKLGQSMSDWFKLTKRFTNNSQCTIGLAPIGKFNIFYDINNKQISLMDLLSELVSIFFGLDVKLLKQIPIKTISEDTKSDENDIDYKQSKKRSDNIKKGIITTRISEANDLKQLQTGSIFDILQDKKYDNRQLFVIMGATLIDLYPNEYYNFVYGQARINQGIGVFSFARYINGFYDLSSVTIEKKLGDKKKKSRWPTVSAPKLSKKALKRRERLKYLRKFLNGEDMNDAKDMLQIFEKEEDKIDFLRACGKVLTHEIGHLFGIKHCIYWECRMNGANHQNEFNDQPFYICPICLHKLYVAREFQMKYDDKGKMERKEEKKDEDEKDGDNDGNDKMAAMRRKMAKRRKKENKNVRPFNLEERYKKLGEWCLKTGLVKEAEWYKQRLLLCSGDEL